MIIIIRMMYAKYAKYIGIPCTYMSQVGPIPGPLIMIMRMMHGIPCTLYIYEPGGADTWWQGGGGSILK